MAAPLPASRGASGQGQSASRASGCGLYSRRDSGQTAPGGRRTQQHPLGDEPYGRTACDLVRAGLRAALGAGVAALPLATPAIVRAQSTSKPVKIGLLSDMNGPYRANGGPGAKIAAQLAVEDYGGSVLGAGGDR